MPTDDQIADALRNYYNDLSTTRECTDVLRALFAQPERDAPRMSARLAIAMRVLAERAIHCTPGEELEDAKRCLEWADALIAADRETSK